METTTIKVTGMTCMGCVNSVTRVLTALPGVSKAEVSKEAASASVTYDPARVQPEQLKKAIREAGYEAA